jgi:GNAT superfamily N-acetyltransferase
MAEESPKVEAFIALLHEELRKYGSLILDGPRTRAWVHDCVGKAIAGDGCCLVADTGRHIIGVSLAVATKWPYDSLYENTALGLGTYVLPEHRKIGVADALYKEQRHILRWMGFDILMGGYLVTNTAVQGVLKRNGSVDLETSMIFHLRED